MTQFPNGVNPQQGADILMPESVNSKKKAWRDLFYGFVDSKKNFQQCMSFPSSLPYLIAQIWKKKSCRKLKTFAVLDSVWLSEPANPTVAASTERNSFLLLWSGRRSEHLDQRYQVGLWQVQNKHVIKCKSLSGQWRAFPTASGSKML